MTKDYRNQLSILEQAELIRIEFEKVMKKNPSQDKLQVFNIAASIILDANYELVNSKEQTIKEIEHNALKARLIKEIDNQINVFKGLLSHSYFEDERGFYLTQIAICQERKKVYLMDMEGEKINA